MLEKYVKNFPEICYDLIDAAVHPLTIIYDNPVGVAKNALAQDGSLGIRLTSDNVCVKLIKGIKKPIISTSANFTGKPAAISYADLDPELINTVDFVLEENLERVNTKPSSIIKIGTDSSVKIIR
jgi:Putative translation factor (SUA5)